MNLKLFFKRVAVLGTVVSLFWGCSFDVQAQGVWRKVKGRDRTHVVQAGENLYTIAQNYGLAIEHLAFANDRDPNNINVAPGTSLIIPGRRVLPSNPPQNGLVVNLPERGVFLFRNGSFEKFYPIAIGQSGKFETPCGNYVIESRTKDPAWFPPEWAGLKDEVVPAGPDNPLGDRWIGISAPGIGFHSTTSPMSIGQSVSHGCMRMYPNSVHELFEKVQVGWPVRIDYEISKIGCDYDEDRYYLAVFPDVYNRQAPNSSVKNTLRQAGLEASESDLGYFAKTDGVCKELYVSSVSVSVGTERLKDWPVEPSMIDGTIWGSPKIAAAVGLNVEWDNYNQVVKVSRSKDILYFPIYDDYVLDFNEVPVGCRAWVAGKARKIGAVTVIPLRPVLKAFNVPNQWIEEERELRISTLPKSKAAVKKVQSSAAKSEPKSGMKSASKSEVKDSQSSEKQLQPSSAVEASEVDKVPVGEEQVNKNLPKPSTDGKGASSKNGVNSVQEEKQELTPIVPQTAPLPEEKLSSPEDEPDRAKYRSWHQNKTQNQHSDQQNDKVGIE
ncbi:MAG: L,D-transpeptidase family protein [Candidatus Bruticola sp.]